jgi:hypothetical protein
MAKLLRPNESISFVQSRAPTPMWLYLKARALEDSPDSTLTQLCTNALPEFLKAAPWERFGWLRPKDLYSKKEGGPTGYRQVNVPFSNMDIDGDLIPSKTWINKHGFEPLFGTNQLELKTAFDSGEASQMVYLLAKNFEVSGATLAYTFLYWLSVVKYTPRIAALKSEIGKPMPLSQAELSLGFTSPGTPVRREPAVAALAETAPAPAPRRRKP